MISSWLYIRHQFEVLVFCVSHWCFTLPVLTSTMNSEQMKRLFLKLKRRVNANFWISVVRITSFLFEQDRYVSTLIRPERENEIQNYNKLWSRCFVNDELPLTKSFTGAAMVHIKNILKTGIAELWLISLIDPFGFSITLKAWLICWNTSKTLCHKHWTWPNAEKAE